MSKGFRLNMNEAGLKDLTKWLKEAAYSYGYHMMDKDEDEVKEFLKILRNREGSM